MARPDPARRRVRPGLMALIGSLAVCLAACDSDVPTTGDADDAAAASSTADRRPNLILILADDLGWSDIGVLGSEIPTPNIDRLANGGMLLTQFYANMTCSPT